MSKKELGTWKLKVKIKNSLGIRYQILIMLHKTRTDSVDNNIGREYNDVFFFFFVFFFVVVFVVTFLDFAEYNFLQLMLLYVT